MNHAIRIRYAKAGNNPVASLDELTDIYQEVANGWNTYHTPRDPPERPSHYYAEYRFSSSENLSEVLDRITEDKLAGIKWYVVHVHNCDHDELENKSGSDCGDWRLERERGNVPEVYR